MDGYADEIGRLLGCGFGCLRRAGAEHVHHVGAIVLQHGVGHRHVAHIASGASERHPRSRCNLARLVHHQRSAVGSYVGPIPKRRDELRGSVRLVIVKAVGHASASAVRIDAGQRGDYAGCRMRDQHRVVIGAERAVALEEVVERRHLLEIGRHVWIVAPEMRIVELKVDDVFYAVAELAALPISITVL